MLGWHEVEAFGHLWDWASSGVFSPLTGTNAIMLTFRVLFNVGELIIYKHTEFSSAYLSFKLFVTLSFFHIFLSNVIGYEIYFTFCFGVAISYYLMIGCQVAFVFYW